MLECKKIHKYCEYEGDSRDKWDFVEESHEDIKGNDQKYYMECTLNYKVISEEEKFLCTNNYKSQEKE